MFEQYSTDQLLAEVTACIVEGREFAGLTEVLSRIFKGRMTDGQFAKAQKRGFEQVYPAMWEAWKAGYYFGCQGLDFLSCMMLSEEQVLADMARWSNFLAAADTLGLSDSREFVEVKEFAESRILPDYAGRRIYITESKTLKKAADLTKTQREAYARRRDAFLTAALKWGWKQRPQGDAIGLADQIEEK